VHVSYVKYMEPTVTRERDCYFEIPKSVIGKSLILHFSEFLKEDADVEVAIFEDQPAVANCASPFTEAAHTPRSVINAVT
jgi:hypothetical protein